MTYNGPYSQATLMYEPDNVLVPIETTTPGTVLDLVSQVNPAFFNMIRTANLSPFYNSSEGKCTLFLPVVEPQGPLDGNTCYQTCKKWTVSGQVTTRMLSSSPMIKLYSTGTEPIVVETCNNAIFIEGRPLLQGDINCCNGLVHLIGEILC